MSLQFAIKTDLLNLQQRFAREIARNEVAGLAHQVLISVSTSTSGGTVLETVQNDRTNSADTFLFPQSTRFDKELDADTHLRRMAILFQVAAFVAAYQNDRGIVVSVTLQDATDNVTLDFVAQCFVDGEGKLTTREVDINDRTNS